MKHDAFACILGLDLSWVHRRLINPFPRLGMDARESINSRPRLGSLLCDSTFVNSKPDARRGKGASSHQIAF